ncbi:hypothetical protein ACW9J6_15050 [Methylobacterium sp. JK268]
MLVLAVAVVGMRQSTKPTLDVPGSQVGRNADRGVDRHEPIPAPSGMGHIEKATEEGTEFWPSLFGYKIKITDSMTVIFTFALVWYTRKLNESTIKLWNAGEKQRDLLEKIASDQSRDTREAISAAKAGAAAAERSTKIATDTLVASNRGWIKVEAAISGQPLTFGPTGAALEVSLSAINVGNAPALNVGQSVWLLAQRSGHGKDPLSEHERRLSQIGAPNSGFTMFPGEAFPSVTQVPKIGINIGLPKSELDEALSLSPNKSVILFVGGCFFYTSASASDRSHRTAFLYELMTVNGDSIKPDNGAVPSHRLTLRMTTFGQGNNAT